MDGAYQSRIRQRVRHRGAAGRAAGGPQFAPALSVWACTPSNCRAAPLPRRGQTTVRSWLYRIRPSVMHTPFERCAAGSITSDFATAVTSPNQLRWDPLPLPGAATDFIDGMVTMAGTGDPRAQRGAGVHLYAANRSMTRRVFYDADGELLIVPQHGRQRFVTELGVIDAQPNEIVVIPRGMRFRVELPDGAARGYVCENFGAQLPAARSRADRIEWSGATRAIS